MEAFQGILSSVIGVVNRVNSRGIAALALLVALGVIWNNRK